jgi:hypothetical protein
MERATGSAIDLIVGMRAALRRESGASDRMLGNPDAFVEAIAPHATEDFTTTMSGGALTDVHRGLEGLRKGWRDFTHAFDEIEIFPEELREGPTGDAVVEFVRLVGKPRGVAGDIDEDAAAVWLLRGERIRGVEFHLDRAAALRAGGIDPDRPGPGVRLD